MPRISEHPAPGNRPIRALLRAVPDSYARVYGPPDTPGFLDDARRQHTLYAEAIRAAGLEVEVLAADEGHPDCHFVEDTAVVVGETALVCHLGRADRRGEEPPVETALRARGYEVVVMRPPAMLEGGDVLQLGSRVYVGRSRRTNAEGIAALDSVCRRYGRTLIVVPVTRCLHLKSGCSAFAPDGVLVAPTVLPDARFPGVDVVRVPAEEAYAANCLALPGRVLLPSGYLRTAGALEDRGLATTLLPMSAFQKGDGALTCLCVLLRR